MQQMNRRKNCSRSSVNQQPSEQCQQKLQRIRCCGRVINKDELNNQLLTEFQSRCAQNKQGQGRRNNQEKGEQNELIQGRGNGQRKGRKNGQGKGRRGQNA